MTRCRAQTVRPQSSPKIHQHPIRGVALVVAAHDVLGAQVTVDKASIVQVLQRTFRQNSQLLQVYPAPSWPRTHRLQQRFEYKLGRAARIQSTELDHTSSVDLPLGDGQEVLPLQEPAKGNVRANQMALEPSQRGCF
jgi:hypothetical protein